MLRGSVGAPTRGVGAPWASSTSTRHGSTPRANNALAPEIAPKGGPETALNQALINLNALALQIENTLRRSLNRIDGEPPTLDQKNAAPVRLSTPTVRENLSELTSRLELAVDMSTQLSSFV